MVKRITLSIPNEGVWQRLQQLLHSQGLNAHNVIWKLTGVVADENISPHSLSLLTVPQQVPMVTITSNEEDDSGASDEEDDSGSSDDNSSFMGGEEEEDSDEDEDE
uniref:Uncharacterized protein n=1 Tax=Chromera velia CCMP2878 TaxID=1169474 RepID=A0A0G4HJC4_9ALVE|eukprot:Cvel_28238.t1-p1 / transcript=Cvel_28238.t1 / gene=Cvel_28238 / organism=Chromera_velia_CCMP2878 / gene_product=hypothetical protein / transcript_product=hypothetical protein / location=Cvel_scaffold3657:788-1102(-) / protein_length=105 / sequence_SO=supercontig / SO=protein_coding / is_pseudo=false